MTAGLETFAKVRALHDRTTSLGEKASAAARMKTLAKKAGLTVEQAVSKLDAKPAAPRNPFEELFNSPEARAAQRERDRRNADRRTVALAEYGSEDAVWAETEREIALEEACRPVVVRKPIINGEMDTLMGWTGGRLHEMPPEVREAVSAAYPLPTTVHEAWAELAAWEKLADDRCAFFPDYSPRVQTLARTAIVEHLLDTLPAGGMRDLRARLDWMQYDLDRGYSRDIHEDQTLLDALRADIERMGQRLREQDGATEFSPVPGKTQTHVQNGQIVEESQSRNGSAPPVQSGHPRRTNADKRRDVLALLGQGLTDREIARRAGVSPQTVGNIRKGRS